MNKEKLSEIISLTDDRFIEEAADIRKRNVRIYRYVGIAACLAVAAVAGVLISQSDFVTPPPVLTEETRFISSSEKLSTLSEGSDKLTCASSVHSRRSFVSFGSSE